MRVWKAAVIESIAARSRFSGLFRKDRAFQTPGTSGSYWPMKTFLYAILSIVVSSLAVTSPVLAKEKAEAAAPAEGKMTADQAKKAVMKKYPAANVISCDAKTVGGKAGFLVKFTSTGGNVAQQVFVDDSGKLTRM